MKFNDKKDSRPGEVDKILQAVDEFLTNNDDVIYCAEESQFYLWKDNYYQPIMEIQLEKYLLLDDEIFSRMSINQTKHFLHRIATLKQKTLDEMNAHDIMDMQNGVYDMEKHEFVDHSKEYCSTVRIPYDYNEKAQCLRWVEFLGECLEDNNEKIAILQEFFGYCLGRDNSFHKSLVLTGDGRNGKGTTFHVLQQLVGRQNCSALKLGEMSDKETVSSLVGKLVNIDADTDSSASGYESNFRRITAGDPITARRLYENSFVFTPYVKLVVGANELPRIADKTRGFYDRLIIIPYEVSFYGREDFRLKEKLNAEIAGIFNWAVEGRKRLYEQGRFSITHTLEEYVKDIKRENNPVEAYCEENIVATKKYTDSYITKKEAYDHYTRWCTENGHRPLSKIRFGKEFYRFNREHTVKDWRSGGKENLAAWKGVGFKWDVPVEQQKWDEEEEEGEQQIEEELAWEE